MQLTIPPGSDQDLTSAGAIRALALDRIRIASVIATGGEDEGAVAHLLMDAEELLEGADAVEQGESADVCGRTCSPLDSIRAAAAALRAGIASRFDEGDGPEPKALEEIAASIVHLVEPMIEERSREADRWMDEYVSEQKAEQADAKAFSERWTAFAGALEQNLDKSALAELHRLVEEDPEQLAKKLVGD
jgi:hypothetical protein